MYNFTFKLLFASVFTMLLGLSIIAPMMSLYAESLGATGIYIGMIFSAYSLSRSIFTPLFGRLSDKGDRKKYILMGLLLFTSLSLLYLVGKNIPALIALRFFQGIGSAMVVPIVMAYIGDMAPDGKEGEYMGTFNVSLFLGMGTGPLLGGIITQYLGMDFVFIVLFALSFINLVGLFFFLPKSGGTDMEKERQIVDIKSILLNGVVIAVMLFRFVSAVGRSSFMVFFPLLADKYEISFTWIGIIITSNILTSSILQNPFGRLADRTNKLILIILGNMVNIIGFILIPFISTPYEFCVVAVLMGIGGGFAIPSSMVITTKLGREGGMGLMMGLFNTAMGVGIATGPIVMGLIVTYYAVESVFFISAGVITLGVVLFTILMFIYDRDFKYTRAYVN